MRAFLADVLRLAASYLDPDVDADEGAAYGPWAVYFAGWSEASDGVYYCRGCEHELGSGHDRDCLIGHAEIAISAWAERQ